MMRKRSPGLYVHVPFCASKCGYCDFYSIVDPGSVHRWLSALSEESKAKSGIFPAFGTLYLGGGTPSLLEAPDLGRLVKGLRAAFAFEAGFEFTLEANPDDLTPEKLGVMRDLGVNRLSIGVQSLDDRELRLLGRRHDAGGALEAIESARRVGFGSIGIDLIFAIPGQTERSLHSTLERTLSFEPEHISCYELTLDPETPLARAIDAGEVDAVGDDMGTDLFMMASDTLRGRGYIHYEVSNFARNEEHRSRHNTRYWDHSPYLGLGPSAHSFASGERRWNVDDVAEYCGALERGEEPVAGQEILSEGQLLLERLYFGFRVIDGLPIDFFDSIPQGRETLAELERTSFVRIESGRIVPTLRGFLLSDRLPLLFTAD
jgi:putative oxygen-independent coproporphyrinogen III oxidase